MQGEISGGHSDWRVGSSFRWGHEHEEGEELEVDAASKVSDADATPIHGTDLRHPYMLKVRQGRGIAMATSLQAPAFFHCRPVVLSFTLLSFVAY